MIWNPVKQLFFIGTSSFILQRKFDVGTPLTKGRISPQTKV